MKRGSASPDSNSVKWKFQESRCSSYFNSLPKRDRDLIEVFIKDHRVRRLFNNFKDGSLRILLSCSVNKTIDTFNTFSKEHSLSCQLIAFFKEAIRNTKGVGLTPYNRNIMERISKYKDYSSLEKGGDTHPVALTRRGLRSFLRFILNRFYLIFENSPKVTVPFYARQLEASSLLQYSAWDNVVWFIDDMETQKENLYFFTKGSTIFIKDGFGLSPPSSVQMKTSGLTRIMKMTLSIRDKFKYMDRISVTNPSTVENFIH
jgi:hypothetical protein